MACSPACGAFHTYADGISAMQASETIPLFLKERQARNMDRSEKFTNNSHHCSCICIDLFLVSSQKVPSIGWEYAV